MNINLSSSCSDIEPTKSYQASAVNPIPISHHISNPLFPGATMNLDLLDRVKKYSNGFCHWEVPAWRKPDGEWVPSSTNFTSLADPTAVGSGLTALTTLMHEVRRLFPCARRSYCWHVLMHSPFIIHHSLLFCLCTYPGRACSSFRQHSAA